MATFWHYLTWSFLWRGALLTVELAVLSLVGAVVLGAVIAEGRLSRFRLLRGVATTYVFVIRGTPLLLQLYLIYFALPSVGITLGAFQAAVIGLSFSEAAFFAEIIRGGVLAVDRNNLLAAQALGMTPRVTRRRVVWPLALRAIVPSLGNEFINLIKSTSLVSTITVEELMQRVTYTTSQSFEYLPGLLAAGAMYLVMTTAVTAAQVLWERHVSLERQSSSAWWHRFVELSGRSTRRQELVIPDATPAPAADVVPDAGPVLVRDPEPSLTRRSVLPLLLCQDVRKSYGDREVLGGVDLRVNTGEVLAVLGGSGSGKSTLLRMINHLEAMDSGTITVAGGRVGYTASGEPEQSPKRLAQARADARIGMVFQHFNLFPHLSALQNVMAGPVYVYGQDKATSRVKALDLLDRVGLAYHADKLPHRLSGGQQQRVAIARALATDPQLMLFDEPTSALDPELVGEVLVVMRNLAAEGMTMLVVTHELRFARDVADRAIFLEGGRIVEDAPAREMLTAPREPQTQRFLASLVGMPT